VLLIAAPFLTTLLWGDVHGNSEKEEADGMKNGNELNSPVRRDEHDDVLKRIREIEDIGERVDAYSAYLFEAGSIAKEKIITAEKGSGDPDTLVLRMEVGEGPYLLGEPIYVRTSIINETSESAVIPYWDIELRTERDKILFNITTSEGVPAPRVPSERFTVLGPPGVNIEPGKTFVRDYNIQSYYSLPEPGGFTVRAFYRSGGTYYISRDKKAGRESIYEAAWEGELNSDEWKFSILEPVEEEDRKALEILLSAAKERAAKERDYTGENRYDRLFWIGEARQEVTKLYRASRYAEHIRMGQASGIVESGRWWESEKAAAVGLELLEGIDLSRHQKIVREKVLHRKIILHVGAGSERDVIAPLVAEFREKFPRSPYKLPEEAREAGL
jgi:hypothetical protein